MGMERKKEGTGMRRRTGNYTTKHTPLSHVRTADTQRQMGDSVILPTEDAAGLVQGAFIRATQAANRERVETIVEWMLAVLFLASMMSAIVRGS